MTKSITVKIERSSHPEFELFGSTFINGRQFAKRGNEAELNAWVETFVAAGMPHGVSVIVETDF